MLEQKYIQLLERRVADLEAQLTLGVTDDKVMNFGTPTVEVTVGPVLCKALYHELVNSHSYEANGKPSKKEDSTKIVSDGDDTDDKAPSDNERYRIVLNSLDPETGEYVDKPPATAKSTMDTRKSNRAFTFRKIMRTATNRGEEVFKSEGSEVDIESEPLQKLLAKVTYKYNKTAKITLLESPFPELIWSWDDAQAKSDISENQGDDTEETKQARKDLKALLNLISKSSGNEALDRYLKTKDSMRENRNITFESLWTLFPKGCLMLARPFLDEPQVFLVQECNPPENDDPDTKFELIAYSYDWNGSTFNRVPYLFVIPPFPDKKSILQLLCYPLSEHRSKTANVDASNSTDVETLKADLIKRGRAFFEYCIAEKGKQTFRYKGMAFSQQGSGIFRTGLYDDDTESLYSRSYRRGDDSGAGKDTASDIDSVVVIDFKSYLQYQTAGTPLLGDMQRFSGMRECTCNDCRQKFEELYRYSWDKKPKDAKLSDEQLLLLPPRVLGYALTQKRWVQLRVEQVMTHGDANARNFDDKLILSDDNKFLIKNAVKSHGKKNIKDFIHGKGKGLVILLWGVPGVGKTLTAESVASLAGKPLFSIGVSDIGIDSKKVETNLQKIFNLAGLWEAVLLFDEADVFLEARDARGSDMQRNTMVSDIAIEYTDLSNDQRCKIFEEFLGQLNNEKPSLVEDYSKCMEWVNEEGRNKPFNGRQIRNIVSTAMSMAHAEGKKLQRPHLVRVAQNTETFKKALLEQEAVYKNAQIKTQYGG
ncbi:uncharacterized protein ColSpa_01774 [Colletotrichum spaethianum]|uniref:AAA+ ATPase domain-containing protein n=1 Tax=Colletotrichum spaethianum TaxID=700344 RepID=A0AA37L445_9PEZI|nr:uncharacterized protein ColSpa_01774 [Colletotrichum spaethianum]GKT41593.1 hypothetical protein ColSpa_01774 [Colletotrichum spaethianum]